MDGYKIQIIPTNGYFFETKASLHSNLIVRVRLHAFMKKHFYQKLAGSTESVKEIGYLLGFEEPTNFIKYFKKYAHLTPTEFREKINLA